MAELASVNTIIVYISEELYDIAAVRDMVRTMQELGKAVLLIGNDSQALGRCAQECNFEFIDLGGSRSSASTGAPSPSVDSSDSHQESHGSPGNGRSAGHLHVPAEQDCIADLAASCADKRAFGACLHGISEDALARLCRLLQEQGRGVLYASSQVQPQLLRHVAPPLKTNRTISEEFSTCSTSTLRMRSQSNDTSVAHWPTAVTQEGSFIGSKPPATSLGDHKDCTSNSVPSVLVVSMNTKGVLADLASAVIRKPDLRCLALALQILSNEVLDRQR